MTRLSPSSMLFALVFLLGIANFAAHKAVLESGHPILERMAWLRPGRFGPPSLIVEFAVLLATLLFLAEGYGGIGWVYAIYSLCNIGSAWALLTGRM